MVRYTWSPCIGEKTIPLPKGVELKQDGNAVTVKGPKGSLTSPLAPRISLVVEDGEAKLNREDDERQTRAFHGLTRALLANNIRGVTEGFKRELDIIGVGYRA